MTIIFITNLGLKGYPAGSHKMPATRLRALNAQLPRLKTQITPPPTIFPSFAKLPAEIRLQIWSYVVWFPRKIKLFSMKWVGELDASAPEAGRGDDIRMCGRLMMYPLRDPDNSKLEGQSRFPGMLHTNQEARTEALKRYVKVQELPAWRGRQLARYRDGNQSPRGYSYLERTSGPRNTLYVNFDVDSFVHPPEYRILECGFATKRWYNFDIDVLKRIKHLELVCNFDAIDMPEYYIGTLPFLIYVGHTITQLTLLCEEWMDYIMRKRKEAPALQDRVDNIISEELRGQLGNRFWAKLSPEFKSRIFKFRVTTRWNNEALIELDPEIASREVAAHNKQHHVCDSVIVGSHQEGQQKKQPRRRIYGNEKPTECNIGGGSWKELMAIDFAGTNKRSKYW
ncbi:hypothetical protein B0O99DRAFT_595728 [Bisporella sp. PMI_857]|nr:hypothetical protein B0O99DRAFT_595728 [Bisporella sp. PMI_857]